jgi:hypothetical protein
MREARSGREQDIRALPAKLCSATWLLQIGVERRFFQRLFLKHAFTSFQFVAAAEGTNASCTGR